MIEGMALKVAVFLILIQMTAWSQEQIPSFKTRVASETKAAPRPFCPAGKAYLQADLSTLSYPDFYNTDPKDKRNSLTAKLLQIGPLSQSLIDPACVETALSLVSAGAPKKKHQRFRKNRFIRCANDGQAFDNQDEPCASDEYKTLVHSSFELTTKCLKEYVTGSKDPKVQNAWVEGYFKMLSTESGLHVNVASEIGAIGIGQLRAKYIVDFKQRTLFQLRDFLLNRQSSPGCRSLATKLLTDERIKKLYNVSETVDPKTKKVTKITYSLNACSNIDINEDQPLLNLIISFANLKLYKENTVDEIFNNPKYQGIFKNLSQDELLDLEIKLVSWSYNLGARGLRTHIEKVLDTKYANKTISSVRDFIVDADIPSKRNYVFGIEDRYKKVLNGRTSCRTDLKSSDQSAAR